MTAIVSPRQSIIQSYAAFSPLDVSAITAWLRVANATSGVNGISALPDFLASNPAVQSVDARKPAVENSANALPCMRFATNDVLSWPITALNSATQRFGVGFWLKTSSLAGINMLFVSFNGTGGASAPRLRLYTQTTGLTAEIYASGSAGRFTNCPSVLTVDTWSFITFEYDATQALEADKVTWTVGGTARGKTFGNQGGGAAIGDLLAVTGNILIGNLNDGTASLQLEGLLGPHFYVLGGKMASATVGLLTPEARAALMAYDAPT